MLRAQKSGWFAVFLRGMSGVTLLRMGPSALARRTRRVLRRF
jgi:hypothetical protein